MALHIYRKGNYLFRMTPEHAARAGAELVDEADLAQALADHDRVLAADQAAAEAAVAAPVVERKPAAKKARAPRNKKAAAPADKDAGSTDADG